MLEAAIILLKMVRPTEAGQTHRCPRISTLAIDKESSVTNASSARGPILIHE